MKNRVLSSSPSASDPVPVPSSLPKVRSKDSIATRVAFVLSIVLSTYLFAILYHSKWYYEYLSGLGVPPNLNLCWIIVLGYVYSAGIYEASLRLFKSYVGKNLVERIYKPDESPEMRVHRLCNDFNGLIYYSTSVALGLYSIWGSHYLPWSMGGRFNVLDFIHNFPMENPNSLQYFYFLMGLGHHLERLVEFLFKQRNIGDFWVILFHHILTVSIMITSFLCGTIYIGLPVLLLHDLIEPFFNLSKIGREVQTFRPLLNFSLLGLILSWLFSRTFSLTFEFFPNCYKIFTEGGPKTKPLFNLWLFQILCVYALWLLNQFWFYQLLLIGYKKFRYGAESSPRDKKD